LGKRSRQRKAEQLRAPTSTYDGLELRGAMTPATRREYAELPSRTREDAWHRQVEFLFERLAVSWTVAGVRYDKQKDLLMRYRMAGEEERATVREALRAHLTEHFPEIEAP
jgi:hypothetical protein